MSVFVQKSDDVWYLFERFEDMPPRLEEPWFYGLGEVNLSAPGWLFSLSFYRLARLKFILLVIYFAKISILCL